MFATVYMRTLGFTQPPTDTMEMPGLKMHRVITSVLYAFVVNCLLTEGNLFLFRKLSVCDFTLKLYWHKNYLLYPAVEK